MQVFSPILRLSFHFPDSVLSFWYFYKIESLSLSNHGFLTFKKNLYFSLQKLTGSQPANLSASPASHAEFWRGDLKLIHNNLTNGTQEGKSSLSTIYCFFFLTTKKITLGLKKNKWYGPGVKNLSSNARDMGSIPGWETKIPHATRQLGPNYWAQAL